MLSLIKSAIALNLTLSDIRPAVLTADPADPTAASVGGVVPAVVAAVVDLKQFV